MINQDAYKAVIAKAKMDRQHLEFERQRLVEIERKISTLDAIIANAAAFLGDDSQQTVTPLGGSTNSGRPDKPIADLIHQIMDELNWRTFRIPAMKREFIKRSWIEDSTNAGVIIRTAALRRKDEFTLKDGVITRIGKPAELQL